MAAAVSDPLSFLPHPRTPPSPHASLHLFSSISNPTPRPSNSRSRSRNGSVIRTQSGPGFSKSAPTSPAGRMHPAGLTPLSTITPLALDTEVSKATPRTLSVSAPGSQQLHQRHIQPQPQPHPQQPQPHSQPPAPIAGPSKSPHHALIHPSRPVGYSSALPPLLNPAASIRVGSRTHRGPIDLRSGSGTDTETEGFDSDSTFVPGRSGVRHKQSLSQPDLTAMRTWAGGVAKEQAEERKAREARRRTPPSRPIPLTTQSTSSIPSPRSKSYTHLSGMRRPTSPKMLGGMVEPMTPVLSSSSDGSSPRILAAHSPAGYQGIPLGQMTGSEDADDDYDGTTTDSPSSGSLTFSPKRRLRQRTLLDRERMKGSLGLSFGPESPPVDVKKEDPIPALLERRLQQSSLLLLRLLAIVPSVWGIMVLFLAFSSGELWVDVWPWGADLSREALERLVAGGVGPEGIKRKVSRGDMLLAMAWAICTAHFCFSLTTGLTHRWRSYYSLPSTLTRLLSLQCLCWPATYLTLWFLGAKRPLLAWIVIGVTTGWSRTVQMWVTSNVVPGEITPKARSPPLPEEDMGWWESFTWGRRWDWDAIAREVGWKVGILLLVTTAWLFWGLETGRLVETGVV